ncbi:hypothetical protein MRX96_009221 [Rhipicephalus microplus]
MTASLVSRKKSKSALDETLNSASYNTGIFVTFASARERRSTDREIVSGLDPHLVAAFESNGLSEHAMQIANWSGEESSQSALPINVFHLNNGVLESTIYRLCKGTKVRFILGPLLYGKNVKFFINTPLVAGSGYSRTKYNQVHWSHDVHNPNDETAYFADVTFTLAGSFHYYFTCNEENEQAGSGYFLVDPVLHRGKDREVLPLDCIQCQTVLTKCLGHFDSWKDKLAVSP